MIISRTYDTIAGLNYIEVSELAFATAYVVEVNGTQFDPYQAGMLVNRTFVHNTSTGRVTFPQSFDPGTKVMVLFKPTASTTPEPPSPPGVCVPVVIGDGTPPDGTVGVAYNAVIELEGTAPFTIDGITLPAGLALSNSGNIVQITGTPTTAGVSSIEFTAHNCSGSSAAFSQAVEIFAPATNLYVNNVSSYGVQINIVDGISYVTESGSFPVTYLASVTGRHGTFSSRPIRVNITGLVFPQTLTLQKNGVILETLNPAIDGNYIFAAQSFIDTDELIINLS